MDRFCKLRALTIKEKHKLKAGLQSLNEIKAAVSQAVIEMLDGANNLAVTQQKGSIMNQIGDLLRCVFSLQLIDLQRMVEERPDIRSGAYVQLKLVNMEGQEEKLVAVQEMLMRALRTE